jgi:hypothetical protein
MNEIINYIFLILDLISQVSKSNSSQLTLGENQPQQKLPSTRATKSDCINRLWQPHERIDKELQTCILTYIGGSIVRRWSKKWPCEVCLSLISNPSVTNPFFKHKQYAHTIHGLQRPSCAVTNSLSILENVFITHYDAFFSLPFVLKRFLQASKSVHFPQSPCHPNLRDFFFTAFFKLRIHHQCKLLTLAVKDNKHKAQKKAKHIGIIAGRLKRRSVQTLLKCK